MISFLETVQEQTSLLEAFEMADEILKQGVQGISDIIVDDALINLDFADVTTIMKDRGIVHMGVGRGTGETRLEDAVRGRYQQSASGNSDFRCKSCSHQYHRWQRSYDV